MHTVQNADHNSILGMPYFKEIGTQMSHLLEGAPTADSDWTKKIEDVLKGLTSKTTLPNYKKYTDIDVDL